METSKYQVDNFIICIDERDDDTRKLVMRDVADLWRVEFDEKHPLFGYWVSTVGEARGSKLLRDAVCATVRALYLLSSVGCHDAIASNAIIEVVDGIQERISAALEKVKAHDDGKDDEDWMKRAQTLDEMQEEAEKENDRDKQETD